MRYCTNSKIVSRCCEVFYSQVMLCCVLHTVLHDCYTLFCCVMFCLVTSISLYFLSLCAGFCLVVKPLRFALACSFCCAFLFVVE